MERIVVFFPFCANVFTWFTRILLIFSYLLRPLCCFFFCYSFLFSIFFFLNNIFPRSVQLPDCRQCRVTKYIYNVESLNIYSMNKTMCTVWLLKIECSFIDFVTDSSAHWLSHALYIFSWILHYFLLLKFFFFFL